MVEPLDPYIKQLEEEKKSLEARITELQGEVRVINNLIYRRKSENFAKGTNQNINQKNVDRLFFETLIIDEIKDRRGGLRTKEIYDRIKRSGYGINYNTLRSYITKMRDKGIIKKRTPTSYHWVIPDN